MFFVLLTNGNNIDDMPNLELLEVSKRKMNFITERRTIYEALLQRSIDGKLEKGVTKLVAAQFSIHIHVLFNVFGHLLKMEEYMLICLIKMWPKENST